MMKQLISILAALVALSQISSVMAASWKETIGMYSIDDPIMGTMGSGILTGVAHGVYAANTAAESMHGVKLFCLSDDILLDRDTIVSLVSEYAEKNSSVKDGVMHNGKRVHLDIGTVLILSLLDKYPCVSGKAVDREALELFKDE